MSTTKRTRKLAAIIACAAATLSTTAATAHASTYSPHGCGIGNGGTVTASWATSCPFARGIATAFVQGDCSDSDGMCAGHVYSPVTGETYRVVCSVRGHYPESVYCDATGTPAWVRFIYKFA